MGEGGRQQRGRQPAVLLARRVNEPPRVAGVRRAAGVDEQAEQEFPGELAESAIALALEGAIEPVLKEVLSALENQLDSQPAETLSAWRERDALLGRNVRWEDGEGTAAGVDESGALLVQTAAGEIGLSAGEVHLRA